MFATRGPEPFQFNKTRLVVALNLTLANAPRECPAASFRHGAVRDFSNGITMTFSRLTQLAQDLKRKGLSLAEIAIELGSNSVRVKRLLQPELYNALEPINDAPINSMRKYLERRRGND